MASVSAGTIKEALSGLAPVLADIKDVAKSGGSALLSGMRQAKDAATGVLGSEGFQTTVESLLGKAKALGSRGTEAIGEFASGPGQKALSAIRGKAGSLLESVSREGGIVDNAKAAFAGRSQVLEAARSSMGAETMPTALKNGMEFVKGMGQQLFKGESSILADLASKAPEKTNFLRGIGRTLGLPALVVGAGSAAAGTVETFAETGNPLQALGGGVVSGGKGFADTALGMAQGAAQLATGAVAEVAGVDQATASAKADKGQDFMDSIMSVIGENPHLALLAGGLAASVAGGNSIIGTLGRIATIAGAAMTFFNIGNKEGGIVDALKGLAGMGKDELADAEKGQDEKAHTVGQARVSGQLGASDDVQADVGELAAQGLQA